MATPPTLVAEYEVASWDTTTSPKTVSVTVAVGDILVIVGGAALSSRTLGTPTGGGLTYTLRQSSTASSFSSAYVWTAPSASAQTFTLSVTPAGTTQPWGYTVLRYSGVSAVGASAIGTGDGLPSLVLTATGTNSTIVTFVDDEYAMDSPPRAWRAINGVTPTAGNGLERSYTTDASWTIYVATYADSGAAGAKTLGLTNPGGQHYTVLGVELLGVTPAPPAPATATTPTWPMRTVVEAAWGADLSVPPATWVWTDISVDVRDNSSDPGVTISRGRQDEASQTQTVKVGFALNNPRGWYTKANPASPYYPGVRLLTPIRVSRDPGTGLAVRAYAYISALSYSWDEAVNSPTVAVEAQGLLGVLDQGGPGGRGEPRSALWRMLSGGETWLGVGARPVAYWSCEEPAGSSRAAEAFGGSPATAHGIITWAADSRLASSMPLPTLDNDAIVTAQVRAYNPTGAWTVTAVLGLPSTAPNPQVTLFAITNSMTSSFGSEWRVVLGDLFTCNIEAWDSSGNELLGASNFAFDERFTNSNTPLLFVVSCTVDGATMTGSVTVINRAGDQLVASGTAATGVTRAQVIAWAAHEWGVGAAIAVGHVSVWATPASTLLPAMTGAMSGWPWETPTIRAKRLCAEAGIALAVPSDQTEAHPAYGGVQTMGVQSVAPLLDLLRQCEAAGGLLSDGSTAGLTFLPQAVAPTASSGLGARYNRAVELALDLNRLQLARGFQPVEDDQRRRNDWTTSAPGGGGGGRYVDTDGPQGTTAIGRRPDSATVNVRDDCLDDQAAWRAHLGTDPSMRYPTVTLNLRAHPELIASWLACDLGSHMQITNLMATHGASTVDLVIEGSVERLRAYEWWVELASSSYAPFVVAIVQSADSATLLRADTDGSDLHAAAAVGATSLSVDVTAGPLWTTAGGDFPFDVAINGYRVHVTAISGASSPQTFTVTALAAALPINAAVTLWAPPVLAL